MDAYAPALAIARGRRQVGAVTVAILERVTLLDELFAEGAEAIGADLHAYRNHAYRVFNLTRAFIERPDAGARRFGVDRALVAEVRATFPNAGFHRRLVQLGLRRCRTHPLSPLPMLRL